MAVVTPTINRIYRMNEFDLLTTNKKARKYVYVSRYSKIIL